MTGPEHYLAAEQDLAGMDGKSPAGVTALLARAQVHATLALAAATAMNDGAGGPPPGDWSAWRDVAGVKTRQEAAVP